MERPHTNLLIAIGIVSDVWPIPGAVLAALVYREGIHSSAPTAYLVLAYVLNFLIFAGVAYAIAASLSPRRRRPMHQSRGPVKGVIYTESELEEFKRRGY